MVAVPHTTYMHYYLAAVEKLAALRRPWRSLFIQTLEGSQYGAALACGALSTGKNITILHSSNTASCGLTQHVSVI
jgi:hypothetical protein